MCNMPTRARACVVYVCASGDDGSGATLHGSVTRFNTSRARCNAATRCLLRPTRQCHLAVAYVVLMTSGTPSTQSV